VLKNARTPGGTIAAADWSLLLSRRKGVPLAVREGNKFWRASEHPTVRRLRNSSARAAVKTFGSGATKIKRTLCLGFLERPPDVVWAGRATLKAV